jgi:hypothetical protein
MKINLPESSSDKESSTAQSGNNQPEMFKIIQWSETANKVVLF